MDLPYWIRPDLIGIGFAIGLIVPWVIRRWRLWRARIPPR